MVEGGPRCDMMLADQGADVHQDRSCSMATSWRHFSSGPREKRIGRDDFMLQPATSVRGVDSSLSMGARYRQE